MSRRVTRQPHALTTAADMASMSLVELADALKADVITYEQLAMEYRTREALGLNPDLPRAGSPAAALRASAPLNACPICGRATNDLEKSQCL